MFAIGFQNRRRVESGIERNAEQAHTGELAVGLNRFLKLRKIMRHPRAEIRNGAASEDEGQDVRITAEAVGSEARAFLIREREERDDLAFAQTFRWPRSHAGRGSRG